MYIDYFVYTVKSVSPEIINQSSVGFQAKIMRFTCLLQLQYLGLPATDRRRGRHNGTVLLTWQARTCKKYEDRQIGDTVLNNQIIKYINAKLVGPRTHKFITCMIFP